MPLSCRSGPCRLACPSQGVLACFLPEQISIFRTFCRAVHRSHMIVRHQPSDRGCRATFPPVWSSRVPGTWRAASPCTAARAPPAAPGSAVPGPAGFAGSFLAPGSLLGTPAPKKLPAAKMLPDLFRPAETRSGLAWPARLTAGRPGAPSPSRQKVNARPITWRPADPGSSRVTSPRPRLPQRLRCR
jgi:hypothetical protein